MLLLYERAYNKYKEYWNNNAMSFTQKTQQTFATVDKDTLGDVEA